MLLFAAACTSEVEAPSIPEASEESPSLSVRSREGLVVVAPFEGASPSHESTRRALGPLFEVPTSSPELTLELSAGTWLPAELDVPSDLQLVWLEERGDGTFDAQQLRTERREGMWHAEVAPGRTTRSFAFLAHPAALAHSPEVVECEPAFSAASVAERASRCGEAQLPRIAEVLRGLCAREGEAVDLDRALRDLPCHPNPTDLQTLFPELSR